MTMVASRWLPLRFVAVYSSQLAQHHAEAYGKAQEREAEALAEHVAQVQRRRFACEADAEAAIAEYEGRGTGQRGRRPCRWRYHEVHYGVEAQWQRKKRTQRGRPRKGEAVEHELVYRSARPHQGPEPAGVRRLAGWCWPPR